MKTGEEYFKELFPDEQRGRFKTFSVNDGPNITRAETLRATQRLKDNKFPDGLDNIYGENVKLIKEEHLDPFVDLFNHTYRIGIL